MTKSVLLHGLSVRAWDPDTRQWNIHWMDTLAPRFNGTYSGGFTDGRGEFFREAQSPDGSGQLMRISFDHITEVAFDWELAVSRDDGVTWHSLWTMAMTRVGP